MVSEHFFLADGMRDMNADSKSEKLYNKMMDHFQEEFCVTEDISKKKPILLSGINARSVVIALSKFLSVLRIEYEMMGTLYLTFCLSSPLSEIKKINMITLQLTPTDYQVGNIFLSNCNGDHYNYSEVADYITSQITGGERDRNSALCKKLLNNLKKMEAFDPSDFHFVQGSYDHLIAIQGEKPFKADLERESHTYKSAVASINTKVAYLNGLMFLVFIVEVVRRLVRDSKGRLFRYDNRFIGNFRSSASDKLPIGILITRSFYLLRRGDITWQNFFDEYGVVMGDGTTRNFNQEGGVCEKMTRIDYDCNRYTGLNRYSVWGRTYMKSSLTSVYGGDEESNDDDYSDDQIYPNSSRNVISRESEEYEKRIERVTGKKRRASDLEEDEHSLYRHRTKEKKLEHVDESHEDAIDKIQSSSFLGNTG